MKLIIHFVITLVITLTLGCDSLKIHKNDEAIIGGNIVEKDQLSALSTVAIVYYIRGQYLADCTGTIISENLVITAAHCMIAFERGEAEPLIFFGNSIGELKTENLRDIVGAISHRSFDPLARSDSDYITSFNDIALIKINDTIPEGYKAAKIISNDREIPTGSELLLAGWGLMDDENLLKSRHLREAFVNIYKYWKTHIITDQTNKKGACNGDSGGPAYVKNNNNELVVVGITRGPHAGVTHCSGYGEFTNINRHTDFILEAADDLQATAPEQDTEIGTDIKESLMDDE